MVTDDVTRRHSIRFAVMSAAIVLCLAAGRASAQEFSGPFAAAVEGLTSEESGVEEEDEHIETDRDSFTPATTLVGRGRVMIEGSYSFIDNRVGPESHSYPEILTRIGLTDWFELRLGWNFEAGGGGAVSGTEIGGNQETSTFERESKLLYGFKVAVTDQDVWLPRSAIIAHASTPTSGENTATQFVLGYVAGWTLPNKWDVASSVRYVAANEEGDHFNQWDPSIVLRVPLGEHWNAHAEYFGLFSDGQANNVNPQYFSPGIHYLITPDCEIGTRVGWGLNDDAADFFSNVGLGFRF